MDGLNTFQDLRRAMMLIRGQRIAGWRQVLPRSKYIGTTLSTINYPYLSISHLNQSRSKTHGKNMNDLPIEHGGL